MITSEITALTDSHEPRLVVVVVIDQFAYATLKRVEPYLRYGMKRMLKHGIVYENAYQPQGMPATATGHTDFNAGTYADVHGITGNKWIVNGKVIASDDDKSPEAAVIGPNNTYYDFGRSARNCMVDGISDQLILARQPFAPHECWAVSYKSRAATACAGHLGKALWFDNITGDFTSSRAYFEYLPTWVKNFNKKHATHKTKKLFWHRAYPCNPAPYDFAHSGDYRFAARKEPCVECPVKLKKHYGAVAKTPYGVNLLFELANETVIQHFKNCNNGKMLLWISISCTDKIGHLYGPDSLEVTDMLYHVDRELENFMKQLMCTVHPRRTLFVLSADHGASPIPELIEEQGMPRVHRINPKKLIDKINSSIKAEFGIADCLSAFQTPCFISNQKSIDKLSKKDKEHALNLIKNTLLATPGIAKVWTYDELIQCTCPASEIELNFRRQLYPGRSGQIIVQTTPYSVITGYPTGTSHRSPYEYDTHVPLILYQHATHSHRKVTDKVLTIQLANSLAYLLGVPKPSASTCPMLPGLVNTCVPLCY